MMPLGDYVARQVQVASTRIAEEIDVSHSTIWQPNLHAIEKWWDTPTLHALAALYCAISQHPHERGEHVIDLLRVAFCRVMIQMANVSFGHQSMSFKKNGVVATDSLLREGSGDCVRRIAGAFVVSAREVANSITVEPPIAEARVFLGDSRDLSSVLCGRQYTTVITSPPYPNRMSYIRELRPYMYWLGFLSDGRQAGELDWKAIGGTWGCATSLLNTWTPNGYSEIPFSNFDQIVREISKGHALLGRYVHKYFEDIKSHLLNLRKVLAPGARCHYIVGNSKFYDTLLPVEEIYAELFKDTGFVNVGIETIRKRSSKKELFEFVVNAQMPG
ncbi:MAG: SAM-dependent methyltransferase [Planctomycetes bacterium]|nr:SAM-dependent methyltransferase [Planctomycetota bacterium]MBI3834070.1 SAM-dependent methyltransferase [Planctomycetota bacterium]